MEQENIESAGKIMLSKKMLLLLGIIIFFLTGGAYMLGVQKNASGSSQNIKEPIVTEVTPTPDPFSGWKTYTNNSIHFSFQYPNYWTLEEVRDNGIVDGVDVKGPEGAIHAVWGSGLGGGCDAKNHEMLTVFGRGRDICHIVREDGSEIWAQINEDLGANGSFSVQITASAPSEANRDTMLQILSTFTLTK